MIADGCYPGAITDIDRLIDKVEQWGKNNPLPSKVIRQDRMLEQFPYATLDKNGVIDQCQIIRPMDFRAHDARNTAMIATLAVRHIG